MSDPRAKTESELVERIRAIDVAAPETLHRSVEALVQAHTRGAGGRRGRVGGRRRRRPRWPQRVAALGGLAAVIAAVLAVALSSGGGGSPLTLQSASALALGAPTQPAPRESPHNGSRLEASVDGIAFPYWEGRLGWKATGARSDQLGGRSVRTVFYTNWKGQRLGYAIVSGSSPVHASGGSITWRAGTPFRLLRAGATRIVTWTRSGRLCVIAARGVSPHTLLDLAATEA